ncbi:MAG: superoxide dismutase family protein [Planctomycetes bacterium]|nr:superoxide dismutase family protein [Planctomycetota bacterium]
MLRHFYLAALLLSVLLCAVVRAEEPKTPAAVTAAICVMQATEGNKVTGVVKFVEEGGKLKVTADIEGLEPGSKHAIHVHEFGDATSKDGMSAGGHFNPENHQHGLPDKAERHAGDLGNLEADKDGKCHYEITVENATVAGKNAVIGRGVIIHAKADDGGQPVGNAGARIACGVIGYANPKSLAK